MKLSIERAFKGGIVFILLASLLFSGCVKDKNPDEIPDEAGFKKSGSSTAEGAVEGNTKIEVDRLQFGFANAAGEYLIIPTGEDTIGEPGAITHAIGDNSKAMRLEYRGYQRAASSTPFSENMYNFDSIGGYLFAVQGDYALPNRTYVLTNERDFNMAGLLVAHDAAGQIKTETINGIEKIKERTVKSAWLIGSLEGADGPKQICLVQFVREGDAMLASIALVAGDKVIFKDFPAQFDQYSTWRVDDGGAINPDMFRILFAVEEKEGTLLCIAWGAFEGENLYLLRETESELEDLGLNRYRYWALS